MPRRAFYSFHYKPDNWRASQVRNMGVIEGNPPASDNDWETIKKGGDSAIKRWINKQMKGKSVAIVLIGEHTANRKWINYEIKQAWEKGKGVLGIHIHNLKDKNGKQSRKGNNPFDYVFVDGSQLSKRVRAYNPPYLTSKKVYENIKENLADWIEDAIERRADYD